MDVDPYQTSNDPDLFENSYYSFTIYHVSAYLKSFIYVDEEATCYTIFH